MEEIKRQKTELDDMRHHSTYLQNTIQERENRIEAVEKESVSEPPRVCSCMFACVSSANVLNCSLPDWPNTWSGRREFQRSLFVGYAAVFMISVVMFVLMRIFLPNVNKHGPNADNIKVKLYRK